MITTSLNVHLAESYRVPAIQPLLSIVIPVFNGAEFIEGGLGSVNVALKLLPKETVAQIEVIVCDNHSTDQTLEIARSFNLPCTYQIIQPPKHYANRTLNWNFALNSAQGQWWLMLHADDMLVPKGLAGVMKACQQQLNNKQVVLMQGQHQNFDRINVPQRKYPLWPLPSLISGSTINNQLMPFSVPFVPLLVIRALAFKQVNGFNPVYELVQDWEMWWRLLKVGDLYYYPVKMGLWYMNPWTAQYKTRMVQEHLDLVSQFLNLNPNLTNAKVKIATLLQLAKVKLWSPETPLEDWLSTIPTYLIKRFDTNQAKAIVRQNDRQFKMRLYTLLGIGSVRWVWFRLKICLFGLARQLKIFTTTLNGNK